MLIFYLLCGFVTYTAFKGDDPEISGLSWIMMFLMVWPAFIGIRIIEELEGKKG
jgi:hypothetical protein